MFVEYEFPGLEDDDVRIESELTGEYLVFESSEGTVRIKMHCEYFEKLTGHLIDYGFCRANEETG